jgi:hypothetical protein
MNYLIFYILFLLTSVIKIILIINEKSSSMYCNIITKNCKLYQFLMKKVVIVPEGGLEPKHVTLIIRT